MFSTADSIVEMSKPFQSLVSLQKELASYSIDAPVEWTEKTLHELCKMAINCGQYEIAVRVLRKLGKTNHDGEIVDLLPLIATPFRPQLSALWSLGQILSRGVDADNISDSVYHHLPSFIDGLIKHLTNISDVGAFEYLNMPWRDMVRRFTRILEHYRTEALHIGATLANRTVHGLCVSGLVGNDSIESALTQLGNVTGHVSIPNLEALHQRVVAMMEASWNCETYLATQCRAMGIEVQTRIEDKRCINEMFSFPFGGRALLHIARMALRSAIPCLQMTVLPVRESNVPFGAAGRSPGWWVLRCEYGDDVVNRGEWDEKNQETRPSTEGPLADLGWVMCFVKELGGQIHAESASGRSRYPSVSGIGPQLPVEAIPSCQLGSVGFCMDICIPERRH